ncbi:MAG: hypothetical protein AAFV54_00980 [Pseudomonadota bacterium]
MRVISAAVLAYGLIMVVSAAQTLPDRVEGEAYELVTTASGASSTVYQNLSDTLAGAPSMVPNWRLNEYWQSQDIYFAIVNHTLDGALCISPKVKGNDDALLVPTGNNLFDFAEFDDGARTSFCHSYTNLTFPVYLDIPAQMLSQIDDQERPGEGIRLRLHTYKSNLFTYGPRIADIPIALDLRFRDVGYQTVGYYWPDHDGTTGSRWVEDPFIRQARNESWPALIIKAHWPGYRFDPTAPARKASVDETPSSVLTELADAAPDAVPTDSVSDLVAPIVISSVALATEPGEALSSLPPAGTRLRIEINSASADAVSAIRYSLTGFEREEVSAADAPLVDLPNGSVFVRLAETSDVPVSLSRAYLTTPARDEIWDVTRFFFDDREYFGVNGRHLLEDEENILVIELER